jgi:nitrous oxidase accessory protein
MTPRGLVAGSAAVITAAILVLAPVAALGQDSGGHTEHTDAQSIAEGTESFEELQARIDSATPGSVIEVTAGHYHGNLVIGKPVNLQGIGQPNLMGDGTGTTLTIAAGGAGTVVSGFRITGSAPGPVESPAGIMIRAADVEVRDVVVEDNYLGIVVRDADRVRLVRVTVRGRSGVITGEGHAAGGEHAEHAGSTDVVQLGGSVRGDGISLFNVEGGLIRDAIVENVRDGVFLSFGKDLILDRTRVTGSRYAVHSMFAKQLYVTENVFADNLSGAVLMYGGPVLMLRNEIRDNTSAATGFGILLKDVASIDAVENRITENRVGVQIDGEPSGEDARTFIQRNTIAMNEIGVGLYPSARAIFTANSFAENTVPILERGTGVAGKNDWTYHGVGNYWGDYRGYDSDGDGVGDRAHHEGGTVESLVAKTPVLAALASGPAFGLIRAVEDRWVEHDAVATDNRPLMDPVSPPVEDSEPSGPATTVVAALGALAVLGALTTLVRLRTPPRRPAATPWWRTRHATT